jgi:radical SAM enzyme (TIGR01210 family)
VVAFRDQLARTSGARLEVAMGLETADPHVLELLNKGITLDSFRRAADFLARHDIALRVFILVRPPYHGEAEGMEWACRSLDVAFECGASVACVIPTRAGNGAIDTLASRGVYSPPRLRSLEAALEYGVALRKGRVFADLWDIEKFHDCACSPARTARMAAINRTQALPRPVCCDRCADPLKAL